MTGRILLLKTYPSLTQISNHIEKLPEKIFIRKSALYSFKVLTHNVKCVRIQEVQIEGGRKHGNNLSSYSLSKHLLLLC